MKIVIESLDNVTDIGYEVTINDNIVIEYLPEGCLGLAQVMVDILRIFGYEVRLD